MTHISNILIHSQYALHTINIYTYSCVHIHTHIHTYTPLIYSHTSPTSYIQLNILTMHIHNMKRILIHTYEKNRFYIHTS